jgi:hypothetical protein
MMQVSKKIPLDNPDVLNIARGVYLLSNSIIAALMYYVYSKINAKKGRLQEC